MKNYLSTSHTLNNTSRKTGFRPNSASKRGFNGFKINTATETPPPIIFTMPNNPKKLSGMGNKIEREQLYENNMQLKDIINKLKRELAETRNQVVKKDIEIRKKERIIKECSKENDIESVHELNLEKARESTLVSLCRDKYNELKKKYIKKCEENEILKANIKITKLKEYQIQIDILKKEMEKIRNLYLYTLEKNHNLNDIIKDFEKLKNKYLEQHNIISGFMKKSNKYNDDINNLKEENAFLKLQLEKNMRQQKKLKSVNFKLKISNEKFLTQKKNKEGYTLNLNDNKKLIKNLRKDLNEYKRLYNLKNNECNELIDRNQKLTDEELKKKKEQQNLKPFNFDLIKVIENKNENNETNKLSLYKSLLNENRHKIEIYELYFKKMGIDKDQIIKAFGYDGVMTTNMRIPQNNEGISNNTQTINNNNINNNLESTETNLNHNLISTDTNINNNLTKMNSENIDGVNKEESIRNINNENDLNSINNLNTMNTLNTNTNNSNHITNANTNTNTNTISNNIQKLPSIEEEKQEEGQYSDESQLLPLLHVFLKNLEAQGITKEKINQKIQDICKIFENKEEATKEEFFEPFVKMFIETMKITQEKDIEVINNFLSDFMDILNGETVVFLNGLIEVFDNIKDYTGINKDNELSFGLNKYKDQLPDTLKKNDINNNHLITFDILRKIVQDLNIILEDESMEYLIYKMKKNVPENNSIFDLNYEIIEKLMDKNEIGEIFNNIKNSLTNNRTNIDNECQDFLNAVEYQDLKFLIIKRDDFFSILDKLNIRMTDELRNSIYELFKIEIENDKNEPDYWMEYDKIKSELE